MANPKLLVLWIAFSIALLGIGIGIGIGADSDVEEAIVEPVTVSDSSLSLEIEQLTSNISSLESSLADKTKDLKDKDDSISVLEKAIHEKSTGIATLQTKVKSLQVGKLKAEIDALTRSKEVLEARVNEGVNNAEKLKLQLESKLIPSVKEKWIILTDYIDPHVQTVSSKSVEVYEVCRSSITPHFVKVQELTAPYAQEARRLSKPYIDQIATVTKPHVEKVHVVLKPYTNRAVYASGKFLESATTCHHQKLILSVKEKWIILTDYIEPHVQTVSSKSVEVYEVCKSTLTPHFVKVQELTAPYVQEVRRLSKPYIDQIGTVTKPHVEKVHVVLTTRAVYGSGKFLESTTTYHHQVSEKSAHVQKWAEPHLELAKTKLIPSVKEKWIILTDYIDPHVQTVSSKSVEVYEVCRSTITPHFVKVQELTAPYVQEARRLSKPYIDQIATITEPHVEKVRVVLKPYTNRAVYASGKFLESATTSLHQASALLALPAYFLYKIFSSMLCKKATKPSDAHASHGHRGHKRRHVDK